MRRWLLLLWIVSVVLAADQASKYWAVARLTRIFEIEKAVTTSQKLDAFVHQTNLESRRTRPLVVLRDHWQFRYVENPGAAWGMLGRLPDAIRVPFFHVVSVLAIAFILLFYRKLDESQRFLQLSLSLVLGGALGNFVDRILRGYVIDFVDWHWRGEAGTRWPTFNVADVAISVGVAWMMADTLLQRRLAPVDRSDGTGPQGPAEAASGPQVTG